MLDLAVSQALRIKSSRIVAKAAKICEEKLLYQLEDELIASYQRQLKQKDAKSAASCFVSGVLGRLIEFNRTDILVLYDIRLTIARSIKNQPFVLSKIA